MKKLFLMLVCFGILNSCQEVVEIDLNDAPPRLVVEANINILENGESQNSWVKLTTTAPFFDDVIPVVADAIVQIIDENGITYPFQYQAEGIYHGTLFPLKNKDYTLKIIYQNETYSATTQFQTTSTLEYVQQRNDGGFTGEDIELKAFFTDPADEDNFYYFTGISERGIVRDVLSDEFFNGNAIFGYYLAEDLAPGDVVNFTLYGIDEAYYNYMFVLLQQSGGQGGGPFQTQPATVRGNIVNETDSSNYPLGYFRISETSKLSYTVQ